MLVYGYTNYRVLRNEPSNLKGGLRLVEVEVVVEVGVGVGMTDPKPEKKPKALPEVYAVCTPIFDMAMGWRLRMLRMSLFLDQSQLGEKLGVSQHMISELENGKQKTVRNPFSLVQLHGVFGSDLLYLLLGKNPERFRHGYITDEYWRKKLLLNPKKSKGRFF